MRKQENRSLRNASLDIYLLEHSIYGSNMSFSYDIFCIFLFRQAFFLIPVAFESLASCLQKPLESGWFAIFIAEI